MQIIIAKDKISKQRTIIGFISETTFIMDDNFESYTQDKYKLEISSKTKDINYLIGEMKNTTNALNNLRRGRVKKPA